MPKRTDIKTVMLIGSGPIVIGQACEFDYSGTQGVKALKEEGYRVVLVNSNPATIMTDPSVADVIYLEPLTVEAVEAVIAKERPEGLLAGLGGASARSDSVYWLIDGGLLIRRSLLGSQAGHEVCYRPLEGALREEVRARIDRAIAACWAGNLEEILLHPRTVSCHGEPPAAMVRSYVWGAE